MEGFRGLCPWACVAYRRHRCGLRQFSARLLDRRDGDVLGFFALLLACFVKRRPTVTGGRQRVGAACERGTLDPWSPAVVDPGYYRYARTVRRFPGSGCSRQLDHLLVLRHLDIDIQPGSQCVRERERDVLFAVREEDPFGFGIKMPDPSLQG